jgi:uncharacterized protein YegP (UPF0339 family)
MDHPLFQLKKFQDGQYIFNLTSSNGEIFFYGEKFSTKEHCLNAIEYLKYISEKLDHYDVKMAKGGQIYFNLTKANGEIIGKSGLFSSISELSDGMDKVRKTAPIAEIQEL